MYTYVCASRAPAGVIRTREPLDREALAEHWLLVCAEDLSPVRPLSSCVYVLVELLDRPDCAPLLAFPQYHVWVRAGPLPRVHLLLALAPQTVDLDEPNATLYTTRLTDAGAFDLREKAYTLALEAPASLAKLVDRFESAPLIRDGEQTLFEQTFDETGAGGVQLENSYEFGSVYRIVRGNERGLFELATRSGACLFHIHNHIRHPRSSLTSSL